MALIPHLKNDGATPENVLRFPWEVQKSEVPKWEEIDPDALARFMEISDKLFSETE